MIIIHFILGHTTVKIILIAVPKKYILILNSFVFNNQHNCWMWDNKAIKIQESQTEP